MSSSQMSRSRRRFAGWMALSGTASILGLKATSSAAEEPPPETTKLRIVQGASLCLAPQYLAEELLKAEGFQDIEYVKLGVAGVPSAKAVGAGQIDIAMNFAGPLVVALDAGTPTVVLAGVHPGCFELVGGERLRSVKELKGKTIPIYASGSTAHVFFSTIAAHVGVDPSRDINWVTIPATDHVAALVDGKVDALMAFPPHAQELRSKKIGRVLVNSASDRPWSQYFCCMVEGNREFVRRNPVATKRALRAILKASNICALEPERAGRFMVDKGYTKSYELAVQTMRELPYGHWRDYDPEDTLRFYALRLHEVGMIKTNPKKLITEGTDWRFLNQLKKELKA